MRHSNNCLINRGTPICHLPKNAPLWSIHQGMVGKTFSADMNSPLLDPFLTFGVEVTGPGTKWMQTSYSTTYMQSMTVTFTIKTVRNNKHIPVFFSSFCYYSLLRVEQFGHFLLACTITMRQCYFIWTPQILHTCMQLLLSDNALLLGFHKTLTPYVINGKMKIKHVQTYQWDQIQDHQ